MGMFDSDEFEDHDSYFKENISEKQKKVCYALCPDYVIKNDGRFQYIDAPALARLYNVDYRKCVIIDRKRPETYIGRDMAKYIMLRPDDFGDYTRK